MEPLRTYHRDMPLYFFAVSIQKLTDYFAGCGEDTVIVFFGDHAPGIAKLGTDIYKEGKKYRTPYLIWTNYANDYYSPGDINLSYLSTVILDWLNMPDTMLTRKNRYMMRKSNYVLDELCFTGLSGYRYRNTFYRVNRSGS